MRGCVSVEHRLKTRIVFLGLAAMLAIFGASASVAPVTHPTPSWTASIPPAELADLPGDATSAMPFHVQGTFETPTPTETPTITPNLTPGKVAGAESGSEGGGGGGGGGGGYDAKVYPSGELPPPGPSAPLIRHGSRIYPVVALTLDDCFDWSAVVADMNII
ncbi:MAG TPA: hypothetical protein VF375_09335 [Candidatus Limnocylindrales bacterium]